MQIWVNKNANNYGPYTLDQLLQYSEEGYFASNDLACEAGSSEWRTVGEFLPPPIATADMVKQRPNQSLQSLKAKAEQEMVKQKQQDACDVVLANFGGNKIAVIKEVRAITGLGLRDAKELVEGAPKTIKEGVSRGEAEELQNQLEAAGAKVELKGKASGGGSVPYRKQIQPRKVQPDLSGEGSAPYRKRVQTQQAKRRRRAQSEDSIGSDIASWIIVIILIGVGLYLLYYLIPKYLIFPFWKAGAFYYLFIVTGCLGAWIANKN